MKRLTFSFYRALFDELEGYETHFSQLQRDYKRELRGKTLLFAVDFSELYNYIHPDSEDAHRAAINSYILDTLEDKFSMLPGAVGELLIDLEKVVPKHFKPRFTEMLYVYPAVARFLSDFSTVIQNEDRLIELYADAETELRSTLGGILDELVSRYTPIQALQNLFNKGKLTPIDGVGRIGTLSSDEKALALARLVEGYLEVDRPGLTENNQIDAADFIIALLLNQHREPTNKRYITIYSQAISLIRACRSHDNLRWDNDYLIREAKYLQFRTKFQEMFSTLAQRHKHVEEGCQLCRKLKTEISKLVDIDKQFQEGAIEPSLKLIDLYRRFDEEYKQPLSFEEGIGEQPATREQAKKLYDTLSDEARFVGEVKEAYEVLKEHLRRIEDTLQAFTLESTDTADVRTYKANLRRWLGLDSFNISEEDESSESHDFRSGHSIFQGSTNHISGKQQKIISDTNHNGANYGWNEQRLRQEIARLQQQWNLLSEKLSGLEHNKILETHPDEAFRLEKEIAKITAERQQIEQKLENLEIQLSSKTRNNFDDFVGRSENKGRPDLTKED